MKLPPKETLVSSIFALLGVVILGGTIYAYQRFEGQSKDVDKTISFISDLVNNKKQLSIDEIKTNIAIANEALSYAQDRLAGMKRILDNDNILSGSVAGRRVKVQIDAKRVLVEQAFEAWQEEKTNVDPADSVTWNAIVEQYSSVINAYVGELQNIISSSGSLSSGLTQEEITAVAESVDQTIQDVIQGIDTISTPPENDTASTVEEDTSPTSSIPEETIQLPPPVIVVDDSTVQGQQDTVEQLEKVIDDLQDQLEQTQDQIDQSTETQTDSSQTDTTIQNSDSTTTDDTLPPFVPPTTPKPSSSNKPKLLQGSDL